MIELSIVQREKKIDIYIEKEIISITKSESTSEKTLRERTKRKTLIRPEACGEIASAPSPRLAEK
ncbi:MAG: hypothetical protein QOI68_5817 [Pseudonocardiales bacterium]|nr:hypothetical protein [Pseudonocardiales bacterium]